MQQSQQLHPTKTSQRQTKQTRILEYHPLPISCLFNIECNWWSSLLPNVAPAMLHNWSCGDTPNKEGLPLSTLPARHKTGYTHHSLRVQCLKLRYQWEITVVIDKDSKLGSATITTATSNKDITKTNKTDAHSWISSVAYLMLIPYRMQLMILIATKCGPCHASQLVMWRYA